MLLGGNLKLEFSQVFTLRASFSAKSRSLTIKTFSFLSIQPILHKVVSNCNLLVLVVLLAGKNYVVFVKSA